MKLKRSFLCTMIAFGASVALWPVCAEQTATEMEPTSDRKQEVLYGEPVQRVYAPRIHSWQSIDNQRLLLYVTAFRPYLVTLDRKVNALSWEYKIAIDNRTSHIDARFDRIYVDGFPYGIKRIEKLDRDTAKTLLGRSPDKDEDEDRPEEPEQQAEPESRKEG